MTNLDALKALYAAIGGDPADVAALNSNTDVLNAIAAFYGAAETAASNAAALMAIAENYAAPAPVLEALNVTANGDYTPGEGVDAFSSVHVAVTPATVTIPIYYKVGEAAEVLFDTINLTPGALYEHTVTVSASDYLGAKWEGDNVESLNVACRAGYDGSGEKVYLNMYTPTAIPEGYNRIVIGLTLYKSPGGAPRR